MAAIEGFEVSVSTLDVTLDAGLVNGRSVDVTAIPTLTASSATEFHWDLISEDGDGTFTVTSGAETTDQTAASAVLPDVPAGGVGIVAVLVDDTDAAQGVDMSLRGAEAPVSADI